MGFEQAVLSLFLVLVAAVSLLLDLLDQFVQIHDFLKIDAIALANDPNLLLGFLPLAQIPHNLLHFRDLLIDQLHRPILTFFLRYNLRY